MKTCTALYNTNSRAHPEVIPEVPSRYLKVLCISKPRGYVAIHFYDTFQG